MRGFTWTDYKDIGASKGLDFHSSSTPADMNTPTNWRCRVCGLQMTKSLRAVQSAQHGCRCQLGFNHELEAYNELAEELGLICLLDAAPANTRIAVQWQRNDGNVITESYRNLKYKRTPTLLRRHGLLTEREYPDAI